MVRHKEAPTFQDLLDEFWKMELSESPSAAERKRLVDKDAIPNWGSRKVASIKRRDAVILIDEVRERAPITAMLAGGCLYQKNGLKFFIESIKAFALTTEGILEYLSLHGLSISIFGSEASSFHCS
jgi:hypothetical protein